MSVAEVLLIWNAWRRSAKGMPGSLPVGSVWGQQYELLARNEGARLVEQVPGALPAETGGSQQ